MNPDHFSSRAEYHEALEDLPSNPSEQPSLGDLIALRCNRRGFLKGALGVAVAGALAKGQLQQSARASVSPGRFGFAELSRGVDENHHVAAGYRAEVLMRWGDPVLADAPAFDPTRQSAAAQLRQFGYNNDYVGYIPLPFGSLSSEHGLLCVNHEYTDEEVMFPGLGKYDRALSQASEAICAIEMACHGGSIIEVKKADGRWQVVENSPYARRISALETEMRLSGPAAGHDRLKTGDDPSGTRVIGTLNNCAGGITPWGTWLMAEENFHGYFSGNREGNAEAQNHKRYGVPGNRYAWGRFHRRFDIDQERNEPNRFGWIVEVDPFDPESTPIKRTALGRLKHEGAESIISQDGRLVVYTGDDQRFEYLYKFVSQDKVDLSNRAANRHPLDQGTLFVARFDADGGLTWLPLLQGQNGLDARNGFASQADVLIETRRAADILGATPMDRPEDVEPNRHNGKVYVMLTNNSKRKAHQRDAANPRAHNLWGHVLELSPEGGDHAATSGRWEILVKAGNPADPAVAALWNPATSAQGWFACPDNCAIDPEGRLWVTTDQGKAWRKASGGADGIWALETEGALRGTGKLFYRVPIGAEMCGPCFTPNGETLFVAVQHPATDGTKDYPGFNRSSTYEDPATRWPDFRPDMPPRPSIVVITKEGGGLIGS